MVRSWVELTDNPDSYMLLMDSGPDGLPDPDTEMRMPLHKGAASSSIRSASGTSSCTTATPPLRADHQLRVRADARTLVESQRAPVPAA